MAEGLSSLHFITEPSPPTPVLGFSVYYGLFVCFRYLSYFVGDWFQYLTINFEFSFSSFYFMTTPCPPKTEFRADRELLHRVQTTQIYYRTLPTTYYSFHKCKNKNKLSLRKVCMTSRIRVRCPTRWTTFRHPCLDQKESLHVSPYLYPMAAKMPDIRDKGKVFVAGSSVYRLLLSTIPFDILSFSFYVPNPPLF